MGSSSREVRVADASEDPKVIVGRGFPEEGEVGSTMGKGFGGETDSEGRSQSGGFQPNKKQEGRLGTAWSE